MADRPLRVLIVDDDQLQLELMERQLRHEGFQVATSSSVFGVSNIMRGFAPDVLLLDVHIPALPGDQLLALVRRSAPETTRYVLYSSCDEWRLKSLARETNADGWISKSADVGAVAKKLREVCGLVAKPDISVRATKSEPPPRFTPEPPTARSKTDPPPRYAPEHHPMRSKTDPPPRHPSESSFPRQNPETLTPRFGFEPAIPRPPAEPTIPRHHSEPPGPRVRTEPPPPPPRHKTEPPTRE